MSVPGESVVGPVVLRASCEGSGAGSSGSRPRLAKDVEEALALRLPFASGEALPGSVVSLAELSRRRSLAVVFYGGVVLEGSDQGRAEGVGVEDARMRGWREHEPELAELGYDVVGVSSQSPEEQTKFALDQMLMFTFLSDSRLLLADKLGLPTKRGPSGGRVHEPATMLVQNQRVIWVFHPLDHPEFDAKIATARIEAFYA